MKKRGWGSGRLHNLIMSAGILTPFDDLVRREDGGKGGGGDVRALSLSLSVSRSPPSMTPFQSSPCSPCDGGGKRKKSQCL